MPQVSTTALPAEPVPYLDRPLRTLREVEAERQATWIRMRDAYVRSIETYGAGHPAVRAARIAFRDASAKWVAARTEARAATKTEAA